MRRNLSFQFDFFPPSFFSFSFWMGRWSTSLVFSIFDFFPPSFFSFSFVFAVVIDFSLGLLVVKKLLRKRHQGGQFLPWSSQVQWQEILFWVFHSSFWAFLCISQAPLGRSLWSRHHWKDLFLLQKLSIHRWCQFWSKVMMSEVEERPSLVTGVYGWHRSQWVNDKVPWHVWYKLHKCMKHQLWNLCMVAHSHYQPSW